MLTIKRCEWNDSWIVYWNRHLCYGDRMNDYWINLRVLTLLGHSFYSAVILYSEGSTVIRSNIVSNNSCPNKLVSSIKDLNGKIIVSNWHLLHSIKVSYLSPSLVDSFFRKLSLWRTSSLEKTKLIHLLIILMFRIPTIQYIHCMSIDRFAPFRFYM